MLPKVSAFDATQAKQEYQFEITLIKTKALVENENNK